MFCTEFYNFKIVKLYIKIKEICVIKFIIETFYYSNSTEIDNVLVGKIK